jgi:recombinational DNA repair protein (RecF pathway)
MHTIHTTSGFVISSRPFGEAGKLLSIFTRDLGLIRASAQGIRFEKSKLRPFIQDYSIGVFSFVRGKEYWRLTNAQEIEKGKVEEPANEKKENGSEELIARIALLLGRLLQGEEAHPELFTTLDSLFNFLHLNLNQEVKSMIDTNQNTDIEMGKTLESLIVTRILHRLGYIANVADLKDSIESDTIDVNMLISLKEQRISMNQHINKALRESHL